MTDQTLPETPKSQATIQQLNLGYNIEQDRMLLRVGLSDDSELVLWLTYRICKQLWQLLNVDTHLPTATSIKPQALPGEAVEQFNKELKTAETLKKMDFATQYQPRKEKRSEEALLAIGLKISGGRVKNLQVICLNNLTVGMNLGPELVLGLCQMIQAGVKQSGWDLGAAPAALPVTELDEAKVVH